MLSIPAFNQSQAFEWETHMHILNKHNPVAILGLPSFPSSFLISLLLLLMEVAAIKLSWSVLFYQLLFYSRLCV